MLFHIVFTVDILILDIFSKMYNANKIYNTIYLLKAFYFFYCVVICVEQLKLTSTFENIWFKSIKNVLFFAVQSP